MQFRSLYILGFILISLFVSCNTKRGIIHRVGQEESLTQIAHLYAVTIEELIAANRILSANDIQEGSRILIPGALQKKSAPSVVYEFEEIPSEDSPAPIPEKTKTPVTREPTSSKILTKGDDRKAPRKPTSRLTLSWPARGKIISGFGVRNEKMHNGIDLAVPPGSPIFAAADGIVVYRGKGIEGYGNIVILRHGANFFSVYAYLGEILVEKNVSVLRGVAIANSSANEKKSFLHFELRRGKKALDPLKQLPK